MGRSFTASNHFIHFGDFPGGEENQSFSLAIWARLNGAVNTGYLVGKIGGTNGFFFRRAAADASAYALGINANNVVVSAASSVTTGAWHPLAARFNTSTNAVAIFKNGTSLATDTTTAEVAANAGNIGVGNRDGLDRALDGDLAEFAYWLGYVLTDAQIAILGAGFSPLFINPLPTIYRSLVRDDSGPRIVGPAATDLNSPGVTDHPRIIHPASTVRRLAPALRMSFATSWVE